MLCTKELLWFSYHPKTFESVLLTDLFPHSRVDVYIQVLQADGGERSAAINAVTIAMVTRV